MMKATMLGKLIGVLLLIHSKKRKYFLWK